MKYFRKPDYTYNHITESADDYTIKKIFDRAYTKSLRYLTFRNRSEKEIRDYLTSKEFDTTIIDKVIELLLSQKFLNDQHFAEWWVEQRQRQAKSKSFIKMELRQKGIASDIIEDALTESADDYATAKKYFEKKKSRFEKYSGDEYMQKAAGFLQRRGFSWDIVKRVLKETEV